MARLPEEWEAVKPMVQERLPGALLVMISEVGYFFSPLRLRALTGRIAALAATQERTTVVACHWRHEIEGWPLRGGDVHRILDEGLGLARRQHVEQEDYLLTVWSR